ncbi:hypothetical protein BDF20DRAFT_955040 [Mycotypha africana]|uniref:uncharacterized protein n=1 Tax=Mycotypha africana TaxID=64632 RepID=UPI002301B5A2|nr:uncharacterized protein BDF20DRAFT_955040 [Mycotypha africana]KAI8984709.1 hypothetical protein BDF20DRAFT_955040 [Mycotypha africana]
MNHPSSCHCVIKQALDKEKLDIEIINAEKVQSTKSSNKRGNSSNNSSSMSSGYHVYKITTFCDEIVKETSRRYSEFASLRQSLIRLYPSLIIPPIPEKHSIADYTYTTQKKSKEDTAVIHKRKRMLDRFLKRTAAHPILRNEHLFHSFIDGNETWLASIANLPKDPLLSVLEHSFTSSITNNLPTTSSSFSSNNVIPIPTLSYTLKYPDKEFESSEYKLGKAAQHSVLQFERAQKKMMRKWTGNNVILGMTPIDLATDYADLGSAYQALSLNESDRDVADSIKKMSRALEEGSHQSTKKMVELLESEFSEHVQDYIQYLAMAKQVLKYRRLKQAQLELVEDAIVSKKAQLRNLTKTEEKSQQLRKMMSSQDEAPLGGPTTEQEEQQQQQQEEEEEEEEAAVPSRIARDQNHSPLDYPTNASAPTMRASRLQTRKWSSPRKLLSAVTYTIQGMMDTDPEQTRRNQIQKLKDTLWQLEEAKVRLRQELKEMGQTIHEELDRLHIQKDTEIKKMLISFAKIHVSYCQQNCELWKKMKEEVTFVIKDL